MIELDVNSDWLQATKNQLQPFHDLLRDVGIERGLIGPREVDRLWERHLFNCAAVADPGLNLVPQGASCIDVGTGAGLPGIVWALVRPDVHMSLVEPLQRRVTFLTEIRDYLGLDNRVSIYNQRAQEVKVTASVVTSRALASLAEVVQWSIPLCETGGRILALKGARAAQELSTAREKLDLLDNADVVRVGPIQKDGHPWATAVLVQI